MLLTVYSTLQGDRAVGFFSASLCLEGCVVAVRACDQAGLCAYSPWTRIARLLAPLPFSVTMAPDSTTDPSVIGAAGFGARWDLVEREGAPGGLWYAVCLLLTTCMYTVCVGTSPSTYYTYSLLLTTCMYAVCVGTSPSNYYSLNITCCLQLRRLRSHHALYLLLTT